MLHADNFIWITGIVSERSLVIEDLRRYFKMRGDSSNCVRYSGGRQKRFHALNLSRDAHGPPIISYFSNFIQERGLYFLSAAMKYSLRS